MSLLSQFFSGGITRKRQQVFTSSGTFIPSARLLALGGWVEVTCVGGGGGGRSGSGAWGGGGAVVKRIVQISGNVSVTVGGGGLGDTSNPQAGGATSFGSLVVAEGGQPGGDNVGGQSGSGYYASNTSYGAGAGGPSTTQSGPGPGIDGYGVGGAYGISHPPNSGGGGYSSGASGICIVEWWE